MKSIEWYIIVKNLLQIQQKYDCLRSLEIHSKFVF